MSKYSKMCMRYTIMYITQPLEVNSRIRDYIWKAIGCDQMCHDKVVYSYRFVWNDILCTQNVINSYLYWIKYQELMRNVLLLNSNFIYSFLIYVTVFASYFRIVAFLFYKIMHVYFKKKSSFRFRRKLMSFIS